MGKFWQALPRAAASSLAGFVVGSFLAAFAVALASAVFALGSSQVVGDLVADAFGLFGIALVIGLPYLIFVGLPLYTLLRASGWASYATACAAGLVPAALVLYPYPIGAVVIFGVFGVSVGLATHLIAERTRGRQAEPASSLH